MATALPTVTPGDHSSSWTDYPGAVWPVALSIFFEFLAILAVALRFYSRHIQKHSIALHDYVIVVALVFSTTLVAFLISAVVAGGLGQSTNELPGPKVQIFVANSPIWACAISSVKISILLLYNQIFQTTSLRKWCYYLIGAQTLWCIAVILWSLLHCQPLALNWNPNLPGHCGGITATYLATHSVNLVLDIAVAITPIPVLWRLQMKLAKKIGISLLFALGLVICVVTITRLVLIRQLQLTYSTVILFFFAILEPFLGIVLASLPVMRGAMEKISTNVSQSTRRLLKMPERLSKSQEFSQLGGSSARTHTRGFSGRSDSTSRIKIMLDNDSHEFDARYTKLPQAHIAQQEDLVIHVTNTWDVQSHQRSVK